MVTKKELKKIEKREKRLKQKTRDLTIKEGIFSSGRMSFGDNYIQPLAIHFNASNSIVALLNAVINLLGPISQAFGSKLIEKKSRKEIVLKSILMEMLTWIPLLILILFFYKGIALEIIPIALLLVFSFYTIFNHIHYPAWFSWIGDLITEGKRGKWFAKRNLIIGFVSIFFAIISAIILNYFDKIGKLTMGFLILFSFALLFRLMSFLTIRKQHEPKIELKETDYFSFTDFIFNASKNNFGRFTIFRTTLSIGIGLSSSLVAIYIIRILGYNYSQYMAIIIANMFFTIIFLRIWGLLSDKYGNSKIIYITSIFIPLIPIIWILNNNLFYLISIQLIGGITWSGFNLATGNFVYDNVRPEKRGFAISYLNSINGFCLFIGAGLGAILIKYLPYSANISIIIIFFISSFLRFLSIIIFLPKIEEIKKKKKIKNMDELGHIVFKQIKPTITEGFHEVYSIKKYFFSKR